MDDTYKIVSALDVIAGNTETIEGALDEIAEQIDASNDHAAELIVAVDRVADALELIAEHLKPKDI